MLHHPSNHPDHLQPTQCVQRRSSLGAMYLDIAITSFGIKRYAIWSAYWWSSILIVIQTYLFMNGPQDECPDTSGCTYCSYLGWQPINSSASNIPKNANLHSYRTLPSKNTFQDANAGNTTLPGMTPMWPCEYVHALNTAYLSRHLLLSGSTPAYQIQGHIHPFPLSNFLTSNPNLYA